MQKFCTKCGSKLDNVTGKCPVCDRELTKKEIRKQKKENYSTFKKIRIACLKIIIWLLIMCIFVMGTGVMAVFYGLIDIPAIEEIMEKANVSPLEKKNIPKTDMSGLEYYKTPEENIVFDNGITYVNNEILVALKDKMYKEDFEEQLCLIGGKIVGYVEELAEYQVLLNNNYSYDAINQLAVELENLEWVIYASPNFAIEMNEEYTPNDSAWENEWGDIPEGTNWGMEAIDAPEAWEYKDKFISSVNIGVIDNMFDVNHKDLNFEEQPLGQSIVENDIKKKKLKWNNHGTHTSGTIAATFDNSLGVAGGTTNTNLYGVSTKGLEISKYFTSQAYNIAFAYLVMNKKCSVINISMCYDQWAFEASRSEEYATKCIDVTAESIGEFLKLLIDKEYQFVICKSSGNQNEVGGGYLYFRKDADDENTNYSYYSYKDYLDYLDGDKTKEVQFLRYKDRKKEIKGRLDSGNVDAKYDFLGAITTEEVKDRIILVGSVKNLGSKRNGLFGIIGDKVHKGYKIAESSQCGERVDIVAPGVDIYSTVKNGYRKMSGTSMAAPHVSAVAGLIFSACPNVKGENVKKIICNSSIGSYGTEGYGLLNAKNAVESALKYSSIKNQNEKIYTRTTSDERDIVLVLDVSGSMSGTPLEETKKASTKFVDTILDKDASIGIVTYDNSANMVSDFSVDENSLTSVANNIGSGGGTNIESGLAKAQEMLSTSNAKKKIIVLMSDGEPNDGKVGDELVSYANSIKADGTYIYTLGFFEKMGSSKSSAQILMEQIASEGCHYEVSSADDLVFFFGDIADQINGQKYIYVRIACPVDVNVSYNGETLSSINDVGKTRTSFGSLTFEESTKEYKESTDNRIKILRLKDDFDYNIQIDGNGIGAMDYTIGFMDENGEYSDLREFKNIEITGRTEIDTIAGNSSTTTLKVDSDGDGKYDLRYRAKANSIGKIVDYSYILYVVFGVILLIALLFLRSKIKKWKRKLAEKENIKKAMKKKFCLHCGNEMSGDKKFCTKCGNKVE